jgi:diacylglycerol kinase family enzyme
MVGAGFDAALFARANQQWKRRIGWFAYLPAALSLLRYPAFRATITVDGVTHVVDARLVLAAIGSSIITPRFHLGHAISRTDGRLDVIVWNPPNQLSTLSCLGWIALGRPERSRWQRQMPGRRVVLAADRVVPFEVDGDVVGSLPVTIEMLDRPACVLTPAGPPSFAQCARWPRS